MEMASGPLTPDDLIDRLRVVYDVNSLEELRGELGNSLRSIQRWKKEGWPDNVAVVLDMLNVAGYLTNGAPSPSTVKQARARRVAERLLTDIQELGELL